MSKRMHSSTGVGTPSSRWRPVCACRRCRALRARRQLRIVESTLVTTGTAGRPMTASREKRTRWCLSSAGLLLLVPLLFLGAGTLLGIEDIGPLAPLLFRSTATITIVPTRVDRQARLVLTAVTVMPDAARYEVAARFLSATSPVQRASGQATGVTHVPATAARGTLTLYNAATYPQTIAAGTVLTGADGVHVMTDAPAPIPAGNPPLFGVVTVSAHAALAGSRGNVAALDIDGLCCVAGVAVKNTSGFSGGQDAQTYMTVRQADIDGLAHPLVDTLTQSATSGVRSQLRPQEWMVTIPACVPAIRTDHAVRSRATTVTVTDTKGGTLALSIQADSVWVYQWSLARLDALAKRIAGARKQDALALLLREEGVQTANILLSGREQTTLPADPNRISITVAGEQTEGGRNR
jgi:hypothetical protein